MKENLEKELKELEEKAKPLRKELKILDSRIKETKQKIRNLKNDELYKDFDPILKRYYTFELPNKKGDDWTDLTGWHGDNERDMANKIEEMFNGFGPEDRHEEFDVACVVFEYGLIEDFLCDIDEDIVNKLNLHQNENEKLINFDGISEKDKNKIIDFIERYTHIQVSTCINDW